MDQDTDTTPKLGWDEDGWYCGGCHQVHVMYRVCPTTGRERPPAKTTLTRQRTGVFW